MELFVEADTNAPVKASVVAVVTEMVENLMVLFVVDDVCLLLIEVISTVVL